MAEGLNLRVREYNAIVELPVGGVALIQNQPRTYALTDDGLGRYVFNGWNNGMAYLPSGMYVNLGSLDVLSPDGKETIPLQKVTPYDSYVLGRGDSAEWWISPSEKVGVVDWK